MSSPEMSSPDMPTRDMPTRGPARPGPYVITGILLTIAVVVPLFVPAYSVAEPSVAGYALLLLVPDEWIPHRHRPWWGFPTGW